MENLRQQFILILIIIIKALQKKIWHLEYFWLKMLGMEPIVGGGGHHTYCLDGDGGGIGVGKIHILGVGTLHILC